VVLHPTNTLVAFAGALVLMLVAGPSETFRPLALCRSRRAVLDDIGAEGKPGGFDPTGTAAVKASGQLTICADITYPPMTFMQGGRPTGFDVDMAEDLATAVGVVAHFQQTAFPDIIAPCWEASATSSSTVWTLRPSARR
jgi:ABC-type amino acid transport substrate-binding protein